LLDLKMPGRVQTCEAGASDQPLLQSRVSREKAATFLDTGGAAVSRKIKKFAL
jgi:hypothetical protein